MLSIHKLSKL